MAKKKNNPDAEPVVATAAPAVEQLAVNQQDAAKITGLSVRTLTRLEKRGVIKSTQPPGCRTRLYPVAGLRKLVGVAE